MQETQAHFRAQTYALEFHNTHADVQCFYFLAIDLIDFSITSTENEVALIGSHRICAAKFYFFLYVLFLASYTFVHVLVLKTQLGSITIIKILIVMIVIIIIVTIAIVIIIIIIIMTI